MNTNGFRQQDNLASSIGQEVYDATQLFIPGDSWCPGGSNWRNCRHSDVAIIKLTRSSDRGRVARPENNSGSVVYDFAVPHYHINGLSGGRVHSGSAMMVGNNSGARVGNQVNSCADISVTDDHGAPTLNSCWSART